MNQLILPTIVKVWMKIKQNIEIDDFGDERKKLTIDGVTAVWLKIMWVCTFIHFVHKNLFIFHFIRLHEWQKEKKSIWHIMNVQKAKYRKNLPHFNYYVVIWTFQSLSQSHWFECSGLFEKKSSLYVWRNRFGYCISQLYVTHMIHCVSFVWLQLTKQSHSKLSKQIKRSYIYSRSYSNKH